MKVSRHTATACIAGLALVAGLAVPGRAAAQRWGEIELPGGVAAARQVLGLGSDTRTASAFLVDFVRTFHQSGVDSPAVDRFERYVRFVRDVRSVLDGWRSGLVLGPDRLRGVQLERWRYVAETFGLRLREVRNRPVLELDRSEQATERVGWLRALGVDSARLAQELNEGKRVPVAVGAELLPLPVPSLWPTLLEQPGPPDIIRLGTSHRAALLYVGLMALDAETLAFLEAQPRSLDLAVDEAGTFAAFARSLRVKGTRVEPAGGAAYSPVWVQLVDRRLEEPVEFIRRLLAKDEGRLAFLYDTVAQLEPRLQTALFDGADRTEPRIETLERHYRWFREVDHSWKVGTRPFFRPSIDPSTVLTLLDIASDGRVGPEWWPDVLESVTGDDGWPERPLRDIRERRAGLTWALQWIFERPAAATRFRVLRVAQRCFARAPRTAAAPVETALRGFDRLPALLLALERMGVQAPTTFAEVAAAAMRLTLAGDVTSTGPKLREWQAAAGILEQILRRREVPASVRDGLLTSLARLVPADEALPSGAVATWVLEELAPALGVPDARAKDFEHEAIERWLAPAEQPARTFQWAGLHYRIDRVGPIVRDATAVRMAAKGPTLTHLAVLVRARRELLGSLTVERAQSLAAELETVRTALLLLRDEKNKPRFETDDLSDAARTLARIKRPRDLDRAARQVPKLDYTFDVVSAYVLPALTYALAAAPTTRPQDYADAADRHLVTASATHPADQWRRSAWTLPAAGTLPAGQSGLLGSLLALDTALTEGQLRRSSAAAGPASPAAGAFTPADRQALLARLLYASAFEDIESGATEIAAAIAAGKQRWADVLATALSAPARAEADLVPLLGALRSNLVLWLAGRRRADAAAAAILPSEYLRLGVATGATLPLVAGPAATAFDGCLCLRPPITRPLEHWLGRGDSGHLSVLTSDVMIRVVTALAELKLPAVLAEPVLPFAMQDVADRVSQFSPDDWEGVAVAGFLPAARIEAYVLALVTEGVLAPAPVDARLLGARR